VRFTAASQSGAEDVGTMTIISELDRVSGLDATIPFTVTGTAMEGVGQDYVITASPVVIPAGSVTTTIVIAVNDDSLYEADETVVVTMGTPINADRGAPAVHMATIIDDDVSERPTVDFSSDSYVVDESAGSAIITVTLSAVSSLTATVEYATSDGTATAGEDYAAASGTLTFSTGTTETTFAVDITADWLHEDAETITLTLSSAINASLDGNNPAALTILDDDPCEPDSYEEDDDASQAGSLVIGTLSTGMRQGHNFCDDATDWNTFAAQAGEVYTITTSSWGPRADTFLTLFDTDGRTFLMANDDSPGTTDYSSRIVWRAPTDGIYYVRTTNRAGLTGGLTDYEVWIKRREKSKLYLPLVARNYRRVGFVYLPLVARDQGTTFVATSDAVLYPTGIISHTCPDAFEIDDTLEQARPIEAGVLQVHSFDSEPVVNYAADKDFVWFDLQARQTVTFAITTFTNTLTLLELYDGYGSVLNITGTTQLTWTTAAAGHYYLSISPLTTDTFGCSYEVGYNLLAEVSPVRMIYLPLIVRDPST
jgi:hypothetical protein